MAKRFAKQFMIGSGVLGQVYRAVDTGEATTCFFHPDVLLLRIGLIRRLGHEPSSMRSRR